MREREVLVHVAMGETNEQIATGLGIEIATIKKHRQNLMKKLGITTAVEAARRAHQLGLLTMTQVE